MKECEKPGCKSPQVFFSKVLGLKVCLTCRMTYYSQHKFIKIPDAKLSVEAIDTNSLCLDTILAHSNTYPIEDLFKGFKGELNDFILKNEEFRKRLREAANSDNFEEITKIEEEVFEFKQQIDSSEMMRNFTFNCFQIKMDCVAKGTITEDTKDDMQINRLLNLAKESMAQDFQRRYTERYNQIEENLKREYEERYSAQIRDQNAKIEELQTKIEQQDSIIEANQKDIIKIQDEGKEKDAKIEEFVEESKNVDAIIELLNIDSVT